MKRIFARIAALCMVALAGVTAAGCTVETSDWWDQLTCGDHTYEEKEVTKQATCAEEGEVLKVCADCGKEKTFKIEKTEHITEKVAGKAATCTEAGYTEGEKCVVCDEWVTAPEALPALGHDVVEDEAIEAEDCETPGLTAGTHCKTCGTVLEAQEEVAGAHVDEANDGTCDVCEESIFENVTFAAVKVGDTAGGWYRAQGYDEIWGEDGAPTEESAKRTIDFAVDGSEIIVECSDPDFKQKDSFPEILKEMSFSYNAIERWLGSPTISASDLIDSTNADKRIWFTQETISPKSFFKDGYVYFYFAGEYEFDFPYAPDDASDPTGNATLTLSGFKFSEINIEFEKVIFE